MKSVMGIINLYENENQMQEITSNRPLAAVPFAGRYRLIDFALSNMVNSGVNNVGVLVRDKPRAIMDHLRSGKDWDLARKRDGLFILPRPEEHDGAGKGDIPALYHHLDYLRRSAQKYVLLSGTGTIFNLNYGTLLQFHQNTNADITILYNTPEADDGPLAGYTYLEMAEDGSVADMAVNPGNIVEGNFSMGVYLMEKDLLVDIVSACYARGGVDFLMDGVVRNFGKLKIFGYGYDGYTARINSVASYFKHSMKLLRLDKWQRLFLSSDQVLTKVKDEVPAKYKESAAVKSSIIANGCVIEGKVENSILFRGVKVGKDAHIKNSIIMQRCEFGANAAVENVICDKNVFITTGKWLKGELNYPLLIEKGIVI